jgi:putative ABC transport system permease protein
VGLGTRQLAPSSPILWLIGWRTLVRHPLQSVLMIVGITLGVAVIVAIDLANASASQAFDLSVDSVAGRATHQIVGGPGGLDEAIYTRLRLAGAVDAAAPVVTDYVASPQLGDRPIRLLGVDPFAEAPFRNYLSGEEGVPLEQLTLFLARPGAILISSDLAAQYGLEAGSLITLDIGGRQREAFVAGLLEPSDGLSRRALDGLILADIATAQELTGTVGRLDHIDLILPTHDRNTAERIAALLPGDTRLLPASARSGTVEQMTDAFRVNLTALSLLALLVGLFLIYNAMTFSVVQRRPLFGTLRCLGVTRREVFLLVVSEALIVGVLGAGLGLGLGILMGQGAVRLVTQTINDLYFVVTVRGIQIPVASLIKGALLGIVATVLTAAPPAWEAASVPPRSALSRSGLESKAQRAVAGTALASVLLIATGIGTLAIPTRDLVVSFGGTFAVIVGIAMLTPNVMALLMRSAGPVTGRAWGTLGRMAPRNVVNSLSRTAIAVAALMVAVSVTIGVSLMVASFRHTVILWLDQTLQGDVYISVPTGTAATPSTIIDPAVIDTLQTWPGVARVDTLRATRVDSPDGPMDVSAVDNPSDPGEQVYYSVDVPADEAWEAMQDGAVMVSEPFARRMGLPRHGGTVTLFTDRGPHTFPVIAIYYDYASSQGTVLMSLRTYRLWWDDSAITAIALRLEPGTEVDQTVRDLREGLTPIQRLRINPNQALRDEVLTIFDRTFAITGALQMLATVVAFIGVLSALLSLQLEKQREFGILRAVGLTARQLWGLVMIETGLMGAVAGLLAMPTGYALALILVYIINRRAFGWTLQLDFAAAPFLQALAVAVVAALLAGIYPARRMSRMAAGDAIRFE